MERILGNSWIEALPNPDMSHNSSRNKVLDDSRPLEHRASHARSCAIYIARRIGRSRDDVLAIVRDRTGVDLTKPGSADELLRGFEAMEALQVEEQA